MYMIRARWEKAFKQVAICLVLPQPLTLPLKFQGSSNMLVTRPSCETGTEQEIQKKAKVANGG